MKKVLIIDDDRAILDAIQSVIEFEGYDVAVVDDGNKAVDKVLKYMPNLILLDLLLSGKDGTEIITDLKKNKKTKDIPIILLSAHPVAEQTAKTNGATAFLAKPFEVDELLKMVKKYCK